jgi:cytochrome c556
MPILCRDLWQRSQKLGDLVPEGSEGGEAAPAIWEDPDGFAAAIQEWSDAISAAVDANPQSLDAAKPVVGPVFGACKNCHDSYRIEED